MSDNLEYCFKCDEPTGCAGRADDSHYNEDGEGPFCWGCWCEDENPRLHEQIEQLQATVGRLEKESRWEKQVPDTIGAWLRINARGTIEHHIVFESRGGYLTIYWGWSPRHPCRIKDIAHKLEKFQWYGPITLPKGNDQ